MDDLPPALILEILSRLNDPNDLARCRLASKTLNTLTYDVRSLNLLCSFDRYLKSREPETKTLTTPFKSTVKNLLLSSRNLEFVSVGVESLSPGIYNNDIDEFDDESDDLHLTAVTFVSEWLPEIAGRLRSLSISNFWFHSCYQRSEVLSLISSCCYHLANLELKNSWLSMKGLKPMPMLTSLTLDFIRLDDEELNKVNDCFPFLQVLNLIGVGGLREPRIHLLHLKTCQWTVSNVPLSLTIHTPNLIELKLKCVNPMTLVLKAPLLSALHLSIEKASEVFEVERFLNLKSLQIESSDLCSLVRLFPDGRTVERLVLDSPKWRERKFVARENANFERLVGTFPNVSTLTLGPGAWLELESCFRTGGLEGESGWKRLKKMKAHLVVSELEATRSFIFSVLDRCTTLSDMTMLIHRDVASNVASHLIFSFMGGCPRIRWRWGMWKEGQKDTWVSDGI